MGLQRGVLDALGAIGALVDDVGRGEAGRDVADSPWTSATMLRFGSRMRASRAFVVDHRRAGRIASSGSNTAGSISYSTLSRAAALLGGGLALGDHGGDPLADEAHDVVEHPGVVGIVSRASWRAVENSTRAAHPRRSAPR